MTEETTTGKPAAKKPDGPQFGQPLTRKEREVLGLRAEGLTQREVAERLFITPRTVAFHCANAYVKLGVHNLLTAMKALGEQSREENKRKN